MVPKSYKTEKLADFINVIQNSFHVLVKGMGLF